MRLNTARKVILTAYAIIILWQCAFWVPWEIKYEGLLYRRKYASLWANPASDRTPKGYNIHYLPNYKHFGFEILVSSIIAGVVK